jgi:sulfate transport system permease protein
MRARYGLRFAALCYLTLLLVLPVGLVFFRTFENGLGPVWTAMTDPDFLHALWLTILIALIAVPLNTIFGIACALVLVRQRFRGKAVLNAFVDLPFALSPVVVGLALFLVYARTGWFGPWLGAHGIQIVFALPAMVLATIFVSLPFVVREVVPVLREIGTEQEEAAWSLGASPFSTFR